MNIAYLIKQISDRIRSDADAKLKQYGITFSQFRVLEFIREQGGSVNQKDIDAALDLAHSTVAGLVTRLKDNGFITIEIDFVDRRNNLVFLTDKADEFQQEMESERNDAEGELTRGLSEADKKELERLLMAVRKNLL